MTISTLSGKKSDFMTNNGAHSPLMIKQNVLCTATLQRNGFIFTERHVHKELVIELNLICIESSHNY